MITFDEMYDEFEAQVATIFNDHKELDDNDLIENNSELKLQKGFCTKWENVTNSNRLLNQKSARQQVVVTNTIANRGNFTDISAKKAAIKEILANCNKLIEYVENNPQLNDKAVLVAFTNHPGPELIFDSNMKAFLMIQATYELEWF